MGTNKRYRRFLLHGLRVALFAVVLLLVHLQQRRILEHQRTLAAVPITLEQVQEILPEAKALNAPRIGRIGQAVLDASNSLSGLAIQTSPQSDHIIGFSGPTNLLLAFSPENRIQGVKILRSGDTRDHVKQIEESSTFLESYVGKSWEEVASQTNVDAVSGATLTSLAIHGAIVNRLGGRQPSLKFPKPVSIESVQTLFPQGNSLEEDNGNWKVLDQNGEEVGSILRTSPASDDVVGYQGPTDAILGLEQDGKIVGVAIDASYDNEPYVGYVREDYFLRSYFNDKTTKDIAQLNIDQLDFEGVSGATMTSQAVVEGIVVAAQKRWAKSAASSPTNEKEIWNWGWRDLGTGLVILLAIVIAFTSLRGSRTVRVVFQLILVVYLGLTNGDLISQTMIFGWAQNGIPYRAAGGLVLLTLAAFVVPIVTGRNVYCSHLCPHGALQQLIKPKRKRQLRLGKRTIVVLKLIPVLLLGWCIVNVLRDLGFSLVDIEPFDAWVFRVAGWATLTIAIVGLLVSFWAPMAYCRYGCPTGTLLGFLRLNGRSHEWSPRDWTAVGLVAIAIYCWAY